MKKLLRKRFMFLVALLVGLCMPTMAQNATDLLKIKGLEPELDGETMYYIKNVGTGLTLSYGGEWGTHCIETQTAHPVILEDNGDGTVSIGSLLGYLDSHTLWMDFFKCRPTDEDLKAQIANADPNIYSYWEVGATVSNWKLVAAEGYEGQYYIVGENNRYLSSVGNRAGLLALKSFEDKAFQRWVFVDGDYIRDNYMSSASIENPIDVSLAFRGGSFDLVDDHGVTPSTPEFFKDKLPYMNQYWKNYSSYAVWGGYNRTVRTSIAEEYNSCAMLYQVITTSPVQYQVTLPAGAYKFTFEGCYNHKSSDNTTYLRIDGLSDDVKIDIDRKDGLKVAKPANGELYTDGSLLFRDNDDYLKEHNFYLTNTTKLLFSISREQTLAGKNEMIYLDNFRLYYAGCIDQDVDPKTIYPFAQEASQGSIYVMRIWDVESGKYIIYYTGTYSDYFYTELCESNGWEKVPYDEIKFVNSQEYNRIKDANNTLAQEYKEYYNTNKTVIESYANAADDDNIFKNYILANKADYLSKLGAVAQAVFKENFTVDVDKINSREKYYEAIAKLEEAWALAVIADGKNEGGKNAIANPSFEDGLAPQKVAENGNILYGPKNWTVGDFSSDTQVIQNAGGHHVYKTEGMDGFSLYNTWWQGTPLTQKVTELANGTYLLSALIASGDANSDEDGNVTYNDATIYLTATDGQGKRVERGVNPPSGGKVFGDFTKKCEVQSDGVLTVGIVGGNDDDHTDKTPGPIGTYNENGHWWYKCDNFRLEYLKDGVLKFDDNAISIYNLIDPFKNVKVMRTINEGNWSSFVVPFNMIVPSGWEVREFVNGSVRTVGNADNLTLKFNKLSEGSLMIAGKPYMVRLANGVDAVLAKPQTSQRDSELVDVNTTKFTESKKLGIEGTNEFTTYDVEFIGVYTQGKIPKSEIDEDGNPIGPQYYFISNNTLYRSVGSENTIKGFRGYFKVTPNGRKLGAPSALRSLSMEMGDETIVGSLDAEDVTVVAIYDITGARLETPQAGINIYRMSDGTTKKVLVK